MKFSTINLNLPIIITPFLVFPIPFVVSLTLYPIPYSVYLIPYILCISIYLVQLYVKLEKV